MKFKEFRDLLNKNIQQLTSNGAHLFETNTDKDELWNLYLDSFPKEANPIYKKRREYDCSCCRQFVKAIGGTVVIKDNSIKSIWNFDSGSSVFQPVLDALTKYIESSSIEDIYVCADKSLKVGVDKNYETTPDGEIREWNHFHILLPMGFLCKGGSVSVGEIKGTYRDSRNVFKRSLDEITEDSILAILELISQNSLYRGQEWESQLKRFLNYKKDYDKIATNVKKEIFIWEKSIEAGEVISRIRNHSIGTLLVDISEGVELDEAVRRYESIVAPTNYKRPKAIFTKRMLEDAKKTIEKMGYSNSLLRRYAKLDDITINNILFSNKDASKRIVGGDVFGEMLNDIPENPKSFSKVEEVTVEKFINDLLPSARDIELFFENKHSSNLVSLIAPEDKLSPSIFKWGNAFSWAYAGNVADSLLRERVKSAGGSVDGVLRFSIQWNDGEKHDENDLDAHCIEPCGNHIYYGNSRNPLTGGTLDVDIMQPKENIPAVENITWGSTERMKEGSYNFYVQNYRWNGGRGGFKAEIEFNA